MAIARYPGIQHPIESNLLKVVTQLKEATETGQRLRGRKCDSFIRCDEHRELVNRVSILETAVNKRYGFMYTTGGSTPQTGVSTTPVLFTGWAANGASNGVNVDHTTDKMIARYAGTYEINFSISFSGSSEKTFVFEIYHNDVSESLTATGFKLARMINSTSDVGSATLIGILNVGVGDSIMLYVSSTDGGTSVTPVHSQFWMAQI